MAYSMGHVETRLARVAGPGEGLINRVLVLPDSARAQARLWRARHPRNRDDANAINKRGRGRGGN
eukprot:11166922-Lingulodinium_polyedra.AAC.1